MTFTLFTAPTPRLLCPHRVAARPLPRMATPLKWLYAWRFHAPLAALAAILMAARFQLASWLAPQLHIAILGGAISPVSDQQLHDINWWLGQVLGTTAVAFVTYAALSSRDWQSSVFDASFATPAGKAVARYFFQAALEDAVFLFTIRQVVVLMSWMTVTQAPLVSTAVNSSAAGIVRTHVDGWLCLILYVTCSLLWFGLTIGLFQRPLEPLGRASVSVATRAAVHVAVAALRIYPTANAAGVPLLPFLLVLLSRFPLLAVALGWAAVEPAEAVGRWIKGTYGANRIAPLLAINAVSLVATLWSVAAGRRVGDLMLSTMREEGAGEVGVGHALMYGGWPPTSTLINWLGCGCLLGVCALVAGAYRHAVYALYLGSPLFLCEWDVPVVDSVRFTRGGKVVDEVWALVKSLASARDTGPQPLPQPQPQQLPGTPSRDGRGAEFVGGGGGGGGGSLLDIMGKALEVAVSLHSLVHGGDEFGVVVEARAWVTNPTNRPMVLEPATITMDATPRRRGGGRGAARQRRAAGNGRNAPGGGGRGGGAGESSSWLLRTLARSVGLGGEEGDDGEDETAAAEGGGWWPGLPSPSAIASSTLPGSSYRLGTVTLGRIVVPPTTTGRGSRPPAVDDGSGGGGGGGGRFDLPGSGGGGNAGAGSVDAPPAGAVEVRLRLRVTLHVDAVMAVGAHLLSSRGDAFSDGGAHGMGGALSRFTVFLSVPSSLGGGASGGGAHSLFNFRLPLLTWLRGRWTGVGVLDPSRLASARQDVQSMLRQRKRMAAWAAVLSERRTRALLGMLQQQGREAEGSGAGESGGGAPVSSAANLSPAARRDLYKLIELLADINSRGNVAAAATAVELQHSQQGQPPGIPFPSPTPADHRDQGGEDADDDVVDSGDSGPVGLASLRPAGAVSTAAVGSDFSNVVYSSAAWLLGFTPNPDHHHHQQQQGQPRRRDSSRSSGVHEGDDDFAPRGAARSRHRDSDAPSDEQRQQSHPPQPQRPTTSAQRGVGATTSNGGGAGSSSGRRGVGEFDSTTPTRRGARERELTEGLSSAPQQLMLELPLLMRALYLVCAIQKEVAASSATAANAASMAATATAAASPPAAVSTALAASPTSAALGPPPALGVVLVEVGAALLHLAYDTVGVQWLGRRDPLHLLALSAGILGLQAFLLPDSVRDAHAEAVLWGE